MAGKTKDKSTTKRKPRSKNKTLAPPRPRGKPRVCFEYEHARELVRAETLKSSGEYAKWWMYNKPSRIPKRPDRAYAKVWKGWGDFLGHHNPFPCVRKKFRSYVDSRAYAHSLGFTSKTQWHAHVKTPNFPSDVPKRPDVYYQKSREWLTWASFLGSKASERIAAMKDSEIVIYIIKYPELPQNVITVGITNEGRAGILERQRQFGFSIIAGYYHDGTSDWFGKIKPYLRQYHVGDKNFICYNINDVLSALSVAYTQVR